MGITGDDGIFAEERKKMIVDFVNRNTKATVNELCERFSVSSATIRNDLRELAEYGLLERTHGGALQKSSVNYELNT
ncbi:MAG: DeoR family transcriptional regulator, partial [Eisenbergiella massiliensis]